VNFSSRIKLKPKTCRHTAENSTFKRNKGAIKSNPEHTVRRPSPFKKRQRTLGPISAARLKGERSEKVVLKVLIELVKKGFLPQATDEIRRYASNSPEDRERDSNGYDIAYLTDLGRIDLQVKSSWRSRGKFLGKHPHIICIVVEDPEDEESIIAQLLNDILLEYTRLKQQL
jgi:hypothetical protein